MLGDNFFTESGE